jgi:hypothetical protein
MTAFLSSIEGSAFSSWLRESGSIWAYPTVLTLHTIGLGVLVGGHWVLSLRLLGQGRDVPLGTFAGLFKYMWAGFWINLITGVMLLAADATTKATQTVFFVKLALVVGGVMLLVAMRRTVYPRGVPADAAVVTPAGRRLAWSSIAIGCVAIVAGRLMAYL